MRSIISKFLFFLFLCNSCIINFAQEFHDELNSDFSGVDSLTFSVIGDIMVHDAQIESAWDEKKQKYDFGPVFEPVKDLLFTADFTIGNLETTLPGKKDLYSGYPKFGAPDTLITALKNAGIDMLTTANNHSCDKGRTGLVHTIEVLEKNNIYHLGTYLDQIDYDINRILIIERNQLRIAFLNYTYALNGNPVPKGTYVNLSRNKLMAEDIDLARFRKPDIIIVLLHCGTEYSRYPDDYQKKKAGFLFNQGVDIVLISHSHVLQPFELKKVTDKYGIKKSRLVVYSLGNFISNQPQRYRNGGIIFNFTLKKQSDSHGKSEITIKNINYVPTWVYVHKTPLRKQFYVLPVLRYMKNDQALKLPASSHQKMLTFYHDTAEHLRNSLNKVMSK
jgi:poly-gamma-glutamate synthesis protein (capsule biosynthesis protein)